MQLLPRLSSDWTPEGKTLTPRCSGSRSTCSFETSPELWEEVVSHSLPSWNQVLEWLLELDALRMGLQGAPGTLLASA